MVSLEEPPRNTVSPLQMWAIHIDFLYAGSLQLTVDNNKDNRQLLLYSGDHVCIMITENAMVKPTLLKEDSVERLTRLMIERDDLLYRTAPALNAEYMLKVGALENLVWKKRLELSMARRRLGLTRSYIDRGVMPNTTEIEATIEYEYEDMMAQLRERNKEMRALMEYMEADALPDDESEDIRRLYTGIVKKTHPDVNPDATLEDITTLQKAADAYKKSDLDTLRAICCSMDPGKADATFVEDLRSKIAEVQAQIGRIQSAYPFDRVAFMKDREAVRRRNAELNGTMDRVTEELEKVTRTLRGLMP